MQIEPVSFFVLLIDVHLIDMFFVECVLHQLLAISFSLFIGMYKEHFNEFVAQPHKGSDFSFPVTDDVKLYGLEILVLYQWLVELYVRHNLAGWVEGFSSDTCFGVINSDYCWYEPRLPVIIGYFIEVRSLLFE